MRVGTCVIIEIVLMSRSDVGLRVTAAMFGVIVMREMLMSGSVLSIVYVVVRLMVVRMNDLMGTRVVPVLRMSMMSRLFRLIGVMSRVVLGANCVPTVMVFVLLR